MAESVDLTKTDSLPEEAPHKKQSSGTIMLWVFLAALLIFMLLIVMCLLLVGHMLKQEYQTFTPKKIAEVEQNLFLTLDDACRINHYKREVAAGDVFYQLWLDDIDDYETFMENNIHCKYAFQDATIVYDHYSYDGEERKCIAQYDYYPEFEDPYKEPDFVITFFEDEAGEYLAKIYASVW